LGVLNSVGGGEHNHHRFELFEGDEAEFIRLHEAKQIAQEAGTDWDEYFEKSAKMPPF